MRSFRFGDNDFRSGGPQTGCEATVDGQTSRYMTTKTSEHDKEYSPIWLHGFDCKGDRKTFTVENLELVLSQKLELVLSQKLELVLSQKILTTQ